MKRLKLSPLVLLCLLTHTAMAGNKTLSFLENKGQVTDQNGISRSDISFKLQASSNLNIFIGNSAIHYQWVKTEPTYTSGSVAGELSPSPAPVDMYRMDVQLLGANPNPTITKSDQLPGFERYYLPTTGSNGGVAHSFKKVTYNNVYPNIDWVFYFNEQGALEHDFIVRQGGKVSDIRMQYNGAANLAIDKNGRLVSTTPLGTITENAPYAYEQNDKRRITSSYILTDNIVSFSIADHNRPLIIDPTVQWATYFGGLAYDDLRSTIIGNDGYLYSAGSTSSTANIATTGAFLTVFAGGTNSAGADAVLNKFDKTGNLIWSTYYGGTGIDLGRRITKDTSGYIYLAGSTTSNTGIATPGAYQTVRTGSSSKTDVFLIKFDTAGQRIWGTYFGGNQLEGNTSLAATNDLSGNIYITGNASSASGISTTGAHQIALAGGNDAFIAKFTTSGTLSWATYYGGAGEEDANGIVTDTAGNIYVTGVTVGSPSGIATSSGFQSTYNGVTQGEDGFLAKFNTNGQLIWGTYYGGTALDRSLGVTIDDSSNIYIGGVTLSPTGIATLTGFQPTFGGGGGDGFLAKFNNVGQRIWATYYGGTDAESGILAMHYNPNGSIYLSGTTLSQNGISTAGGFQSAFSGAQDAFISRVNAASGMLLWGSYFGGLDADVGSGITGDNTGNIFMSGNTTSATGMASVASYQSSFGGGSADGFLLRIKDCVLPQTPDTISGAVTVCSGSQHTYSVSSQFANTYTWILASGWIGNSTTDSITVTFNGSSDIIRVVTINDCDVSDTVSLSIIVNPLPITPVILMDGNILSAAQPYSTYQWNLDGTPIAGADDPTYTVTQLGSYSLTVGNSEGCLANSESINITPTAITDLLLQNGITIYPNPIEDKLFIKLRSKATLTITSIDGKNLNAENLKIGTSKLDFSGYSTGAYILSLTDENGILLSTKKITKNK